MDRSLTPGGDRPPVFEHFRYPQPRSLGRLSRQRSRREETASDDLAVWLGRPILAEVTDQIDRDVVSAGNVACVAHTVQDRFGQHFYSSLFQLHPSHGIARCFSHPSPPPPPVP